MYKYWTLSMFCRAMSIRMINDQIMQLERAFIDQSALPGRITYRCI